MKNFYLLLIISTLMRLLVLIFLANYLHAIISTGVVLTKSFDAKQGKAIHLFINSFFSKMKN